MGAKENTVAQRQMVFEAYLIDDLRDGSGVILPLHAVTATTKSFV